MTNTLTRTSAAQMLLGGAAQTQSASPVAAPAPAPTAAPSARRRRMPHAAEATASAANAVSRAHASASNPPAIPASAPGPRPRPSIAGGDWPIDHARARRDAEVALSLIDFSKRDIIIWVPGTRSFSVNEAFADALAEKHRTGDYSLTAMRYMASWDLRPSVATGLESLRLLLQGLTAHTGNHRIILAGESQGAWLIGEAMSDPKLRKVVHRAALLGHPASARHHYESGYDPGIVEINDTWDHITIPVPGRPDIAVDTMAAIRKGDMSNPGRIIRTLLTAPLHGLLMIGSTARSFLGEWEYDPHNYDWRMGEAADFVLAGRQDQADRRRRPHPSSAAASRGERYK